MSQGEVGDEVGEVGEASSLRQIIKCEGAWTIPMVAGTIRGFLRRGMIRVDFFRQIVLKKII